MRTAQLSLHLIWELQLLMCTCDGSDPKESFPSWTFPFTVKNKQRHESPPQNPRLCGPKKRNVSIDKTTHCIAGHARHCELSPLNSSAGNQIWSHESKIGQCLHTNRTHIWKQNRQLRHLLGEQGSKKHRSYYRNAPHNGIFWGDF